MDKLLRPNWHQYFLWLAHVVKLRSLDPHTKHGSVIVYEKMIIGTGYNSPIRGLADEDVPLTRPEKYTFMFHSEHNAILNCGINLKTLPKKPSIYVTGMPCTKCIQVMIQSGISDVFYDQDRNYQGWDSEEERKLRTFLLQASPSIILHPMVYNYEEFAERLLE